MTPDRCKHFEQGGGLKCVQVQMSIMTCIVYRSAEETQNNANTMRKVGLEVLMIKNFVFI